MAENAVELPNKTTADAGSFTEFKAIAKGEKIPVTPAVEVPETKPAAVEAAKPAETGAVEQPAKDSQETGKPKDKSAHGRALELAKEGRFEEAKKILEAADNQRTADLRKQLEEARAPKPAAPPPVETKPPEPVKADTEPKLEDFKDKPYEDYIRAVARWEYRQEAAKERAQSQQQTAQQKFAVKVAAIRVDPQYADFDQVADVVTRTGVNLPPAMGEFIRDSDVGLKVLYSLGQNPQEYVRIASLPPVRQVAELAWIEKALATPQSPPIDHPEPPKPLPVSQVPKPPRQLGGIEPPAPVSSRDAKTFEEFKAAEKARLAGRAN